MSLEDEKFRTLTEATKKKPRRLATMRVYREMDQAVGEFVKTDLAKRLGFMYKADVYTAAVRELLWKYGLYENPGDKEAQA